MRAQRRKVSRVNANPEQAKFWNDLGGQEWVALQDRLDRQLAPLGEAAIAVADPQPGQTVLDVGCGCGATTLTLAAAVGPAGSVRGLDISAPMTEVARARAAAAGLDQLDVEVGDAQDASLATGSYDLVFSRFGVMFFADPVAAFANLRAAAKPTGRLAFVCWAKPSENAWSAVTGRALMAVLPPQPVPDPLAPGPFAFADPERIRQILGDAGWQDIAIEEYRRTLQLGGSTDFDEIVDLSLRIGPASRALLGADDALRSAARDAIVEALRPLHGADGVLLDGVCWIVSARP